MGEVRPPVPPFTVESATQKVRMAEDAWNTRDTQWRNRAHFPQRKWARELDYWLIEELRACAGPLIAVRFAYEWHDDSGQWFRSYGNENREFTEHGLMARRFASINGLPIREADRLLRWPLGHRPDEHPGAARPASPGTSRPCPTAASRSRSSALAGSSPRSSAA
jgi:nuclear transport factor 2 (NTF2) superfamily protein